MSEVSSLIQEHQLLLGWIGSVSLGMLVLTVVAFPIVVVNLPSDYFVRERRQLARVSRRHPAVWWFLTIVKNILGLVLILAGVAMLVLPGQGLLTILMGLALMNFPGKYALERRIVGRPAIAAALNRMRRVAGKPPLEIPSLEPAQSDGAAAPQESTAAGTDAARSRRSR
jgi:hypothetical protein